MKKHFYAYDGHIRLFVSTKKRDRDNICHDGVYAITAAEAAALIKTGAVRRFYFDPIRKGFYA